MTNYKNTEHISRHDTNFRVLTTFVIVLLVAASAFFLNIHNEPIAPDSDEIIHTRVTQEMLISGNWLTPTHGGKPYLNKPPLKMWLTAAVLLIFGESNFTYRVVDGVFGIVLIGVVFFAIFRICKSLVGAAVGSLLLVFSPAMLLGRHGFRRATQDGALTTLCTIATLIGLDLIQKLYLKDKPNISYSRAFAIGLIVGCAALVKSAAGFLPLLIISPFIIFGRHTATLFERIKLLATMILPAFVLPAAYYIPTMIRVKYGYVVAIRQELIGRALRGYHNQADTWHYIRFLFGDIFDTAGSLPNSLLIISLLCAIWRFYQKRAIHEIYLISAFAIPTIFYSICSSRQPWYIFPVLPIGAILIGLTTTQAIKFISAKSFPRFMAGASFILLAVCLGFHQARFCFNKIADPKFHRFEMELLVQDLKKADGRFGNVNKILVPFKYSSHRSERGTYNIEAIYLQSLRNKIVSMPRGESNPIPYITPEISHLLIKKSWVQSVENSIKVRQLAEIPAFRAREDAAVLLAINDKPDSP